MDETVVALYTEKSLITVRAGIYQLMNILEYFHQFSLFLLHTAARSVQEPLFHLLFTGFFRVYPVRLLQFDVISFFTNSFFLSLSQ